MTQLTVKVAKITQEATDIVSFELIGTTDAPLPAFDAGAHVDVHIPVAGHPDLIRQYSLCNNPTEHHRYVIGVLRDPASRGGSVAMHQVQEGQLLRISAPRNHFTLVPAQHTLLFAGGIGITPILCMAEQLSNEHRNFAMHYCSKSADRCAFQARIRAAPFADRVRFHRDDGAAEQRLNLQQVLRQAPPDSHVYVCGPAGYIAFILAGARELAWAEERLHVEYFSGAVQDTGSDNSFQVKIASSGKMYTIAAEQSVTRVLEENGIIIPVSCEQGVCGTCITRILEGSPEHRDLYFTDEEHAANDQFTPCCSRSKSPVLVLDL